MGGMLAGPGGALIGAGIGGVAGGVQGSLMGRQKKAAQSALEAQQEAVRQEMARRNQAVGQVKDIYGEIPAAGEAYRNMGVAVRNNAMLSGAINAQAAAVRDAAGQNLAGAAQVAGRDARAAAASKGLAGLGSSLDQSNKQALLGSFLGNRAANAGAVEATRTGGWNAVADASQNLQNWAAQGANIRPGQAAISQGAQIEAARGALPANTFGSVLSTAGNVLGQSMLSNAQGGIGLGALGLPNLPLSQGNALSGSQNQFGVTPVGGPAEGSVPGTRNVAIQPGAQGMLSTGRWR